MLARLRKTIFGPVPTQTLVDAGVLPVNVPMLRRQLEVACQVKLPLSKGADLEGICSFLGTLLDVLEQPDGSALVIDRSEHNDAGAVIKAPESLIAIPGSQTPKGRKRGHPGASSAPQGASQGLSSKLKRKQEAYWAGWWKNWMGA